jgi:hypothetical protein
MNALSYRRWLATREACNEKVGLRPLVCFAKCRYTAVLGYLIYARARGKDKRGKLHDFLRAVSTCWIVEAIPVGLVAAMRHDSENNLLAAWKMFLSFFKREWKLSDYPIRVREHEVKPDDVSGRLKQKRYSASIVNWWVTTGTGNTKEEALRDLERTFENVRLQKVTANKPLPRPGKHVPIEFASRQRIDEHGELAEDFVHRVLGLDWAWISEESSLWDFHSDETNVALTTKIKEVYDVDVSDIESANLFEILGRIANSRQHA